MATRDVELNKSKRNTEPNHLHSIYPELDNYPIGVAMSNTSSGDVVHVRLSDPGLGFENAPIAASGTLSFDYSDADKWYSVNANWTDGAYFVAGDNITVGDLLGVDVDGISVTPYRGPDIRQRKNQNVAKSSFEIMVRLNKDIQDCRVDVLTGRIHVRNYRGFIISYPLSEFKNDGEIIIFIDVIKNMDIED